jgi:hypothetical protein
VGRPESVGGLEIVGEGKVDIDMLYSDAALPLPANQTKSGDVPFLEKMNLYLS